MIDNRECVKSGTLNQLILHLTSMDSQNAISGSDFFQTFMITLQTFTEPQNFVDKMIERFKIPPMPENELSRPYEELKFAVQFRVCSVL